MIITEINTNAGEATKRQLTQEEVDALTPTQKEIQQWVQEETKRRQEEALRKFQKKQVLESIQAFKDAEAINNKDMFPLWEQGLQVKVGEKYQHFNADNEIVLYKVVKENTTKYNDLQPKDNTELFIELPSKEKLTKY